MRTVIDVPEIRADKKDLPPKKRVWGFRAPVRHRIRKSASQVAESRRENAPTPTTIALGRWFYLTPDPIGLIGGLNLYLYVMNDPINLVDQDGLFPKRFDKFYGLPQKFWNWAEKNRLRKMKCKGEMISEEDARDLHKEWEDLKRPGRDGGKWWEDVIDMFMPPFVVDPCQVFPGLPGCTRPTSGLFENRSSGFPVGSAAIVDTQSISLGLG